MPARRAGDELAQKMTPAQIAEAQKLAREWKSNKEAIMPPERRSDRRASMTTHYFPEADDPALQPFTQAFVHLMFAHAAFERRVSELMDIITGVVRFGERPENQWKADQRPKRMKKLIREYHPDGLPETDAIAACLKRAISFCRDRNLLAHGSWWEFDIDANTITVRSGVARPNEDQHRQYTVADIQAVAASLDDLEVGLWKHQRAIEKRPQTIRPTAARWGSIRALLRWLVALIRRA